MKKIIFFLALICTPGYLFSQPYFQKITTGVVATDLSSSTMAAWGDYNNDGFQDLVVVPWNDGCWSCRSPIRFYKNNGDGTFTIGSSVLIDAVLSCNGVAWGDYDNDGRPDVFISRYLNQTNLLFHNDSVDFSQISSGSIVTDVASSTGCAWGDYDKDGWLDLFVSHGQNQNNALYHNNGNGTFTGIFTGSIVNDGGDSRGCAWGDYDNDSWPDLFVNNYSNQKPFLYHNNGNGTFTKITNASPVESSGWGSECMWLDYDNDGWLDLLVTYNSANNRLYHNNQNGTFTLTNLAPSQEWGWSYSSAFADIDNDGWIDIFIPKRNMNNFTSANALFKNVNGTGFVKITNDIVSQEGGACDAGIFGDINNDGKMDLFVTNGSTGSLTNNYLYENVTPNAGNYITIKLKGCTLNKSAIGARIKIVTGNLKQMREISGGISSQSMLWQHFGLGNAAIIDSVIVFWTTGNVQMLTNVKINQDLTVTECPVGILSNQMPVKYELKQNYPNPFNPFTQIEYSIVKSSNVKVSIYDVTGKFIGMPVNEFKGSGNYSIEFNGTDLASGIYIYKIETEEFTAVKKMMLVK